MKSDAINDILAVLLHWGAKEDVAAVEQMMDRVEKAEAELVIYRSAYEELKKELIAAKMDYSEEIAVKDAESKALVSTIKELVDAYPNLFPRICACCGK